MSKEERDNLGTLGQKHFANNYGNKVFRESWEKLIDNVHKKYGSWKNKKYKNWEIVEL